MPRINRIDISDTVYYVINRANARMQIFDKDKDYVFFEETFFNYFDRYPIY